jgi:hypothetical protein
MEVLPLIYLFFIGLMADVIGSFRSIGRIGAFIALLFFTPFFGLMIIYAFPGLPKAICMHDYQSFHAGITYRFKRRNWRGKQYFVVVNDVDVVLSQFEFTEYFALVETRKQYLRKKKLLKNEEINT